jgi:DNA-directed RNA polymerase subunit RPC12/RpoP
LKRLYKNNRITADIVTAMVKCPNCNKEVAKPQKSWKYWKFIAEAYLCNNCGTKFTEYVKNGKHAFTLKLEKGKGYVKA